MESQGALKVEEGGRRLKDVRRTRAPLVAWKMEEGNTSQGMQVVSRS